MYDSPRLTSSLFLHSTTFMFKSPSACNMFTIVFNFFVGLAGALVTLILRSIHGVQVLNGNPGNLLLISQIIEWILRYVDLLHSSCLV